MPSLEPTVLSDQDCLQRLADASIGRIAWADDGGTVTVIPVNVALDGGHVVFRTSEHVAAQLRAAAGRQVVQADQMEEALQAGWSVLVHGDLAEVDDPEEVRRIADLVHPWTGSGAHVTMRLTPTRVTGRQIPVHPGGVFLMS